MRAKKTGSKASEGLKQMPIHFRLIGQSPTMTVGTMVFAGFVLAEEPLPGAVGQLTSNDLVGEGAHVTRTFTLQYLEWREPRVTKSLCQPSLQGD
jgi:hypothetical protein